MATLLDRLDAWALEPDPASDAVLAALADSGQTAAALSNQAQLVLDAETRFGELEARLLGLVACLSDDDTASLHRAAIDQRSVVAAGAWSYVRQAGIYLPLELRELAAAGRIDEAWHAREALRLLACLTLLQPLVAQLEKDTLPADQFARQVRAQAAQLAKVQMEAD